MPMKRTIKFLLGSQDKFSSGCNKEPQCMRVVNVLLRGVTGIVTKSENAHYVTLSFCTNSIEKVVEFCLFFRKPLTLRHFIKIEEETRKTTKQHWHTKNASHKTNNTWKATRIYCVCMAHKQREGGGTICPAVTFGKYGFTLTERKLSPHEQKLWPLAIRRGGGGSLFGQMAYLSQLGLAWLAFIVAWTFCYFAILLSDIVNYRPPSAKQFHILAVWLMQARNQLSKWHLVLPVQFVACVVTNWIFLATQRDQKENEDWRQNMVDFKKRNTSNFWLISPSL